MTNNSSSSALSNSSLKLLNCKLALRVIPRLNASMRLKRPVPNQDLQTLVSKYVSEHLGFGTAAQHTPNLRVHFAVAAADEHDDEEDELHAVADVQHQRADHDDVRQEKGEEADGLALGLLHHLHQHERQQRRRERDQLHERRDDDPHRHRARRVALVAVVDPPDAQCHDEHAETRVLSEHEALELLGQVVECEGDEDRGQHCDCDEGGSVENHFGRPAQVSEAEQFAMSVPASVSHLPSNIFFHIKYNNKFP